MGDFVQPLAGDTHRRSGGVNVLVTGFGAFRHTTRNPSWETAKLLAKSFNSASKPRQEIAIDIAYVPVEYESVISTISYFYGLNEEVPKLPSDMANHVDIAARSDFDPQKRYDLILHIGQGRSGGIRLESSAHQLGYRLLDAADTLAPIISDVDEATDPDSQVPEQLMCMQERSAGMNRGYPVGESIKAALGDEFELESTIDTARLAEKLSEQYPGISIRKSTNAGRYLCEFIYFGSLAGVVASQMGSADSTTTEHKHGQKVLFIHVPPENDPLSIQDMAHVVSSAVEDISIEIMRARS